MLFETATTYLQSQKEGGENDIEKKIALLNISAIPQCHVKLHIRSA